MRSCGLIKRNGKWYVKNYGRKLKSKGMSRLRAVITAWSRNRKKPGYSNDPS